MSPDISRINILENRIKSLSEKMFNFFSTQVTAGSPIRVAYVPTSANPFIDQTWHELKLAMNELKNLKEEN